jgi:hypothetical protein
MFSITPRVIIEGLKNNAYFAAGQIATMFLGARIIVGGECELSNYNANNLFLEADLPIFENMKNGDNIRINFGNGTPIDRTIINKISDYVVEINPAYTIPTTVKVFVSKELTNAFEGEIVRFIVDNISANNYINKVSNYEQGYYTFGNDTSLGFTNKLNAAPLFKQIDKNIFDFNGAFITNNISYGNDTGANGIHSALFTFGNHLANRNDIQNATGLFFFPLFRRIFHHINPYLLRDVSGNARALFNYSFAFQPELFQTNDELRLDNSFELVQFGYFDELGNGQLPPFVPYDILINNGSGLAFNTLPQNIKFKYPLQANTNNIIYLVFQRMPVDGVNFDLDKDYQWNWGVTFAFFNNLSNPTLTTLPNQLVQITSMSITASGSDWLYTCNFNLSPRINDLLQFKGLACYVVIDTDYNNTTTINQGFTISHKIFEEVYTAPSITPNPMFTLLTQTFSPYETYNLNIHEFIHTITSYQTTRVLFNLQINNTNVYINNIKAMIKEATYNVILEQYQVNVSGHQFTSAGYPIIDYKLPTQGDPEINNYTTFSINTNTNQITIAVPVVHRRESWLPLQPNNGAFYNPSLPNNGQSFDFLNYGKIFVELSIEYTYNNSIGTYSTNSILIKLINDNLKCGKELLDHNIVGIFDLNNNPVTTLTVGETYYLRVTPLPHDMYNHVASLKYVHINNDNINTMGYMYGNGSLYTSSNKKIFTEQIGDNFYFIPPKAGDVTIWVLFAKNSLTPFEDSTLSRRISFTVKPKPELLPDITEVDYSCCEPRIVYITDKNTIFYNQDHLITLKKDGITIANINDDTLGKYYDYDNILGYQVFTVDWNIVFTQHGLGEYVFEANGVPISPTYCLTNNLSLINKTIYIEYKANKTVSTFDFKNYPVVMGFRLDGILQKESYSVEREEISLSSGIILPSNQKISTNFLVQIKQMYRYEFELIKFGLVLNEWTIEVNDTNNVLSGIYKIIPPSSIDPTWHYKRNFCSFSFETKLINILSSQNC